MVKICMAVHENCKWLSTISIIQILVCTCLSYETILFVNCFSLFFNWKLQNSVDWLMQNVECAGDQSR